MKLNINQYLDDRNNNIWKELISKYSIELFYEPKETSWMVNTNDPYFKKIYTPTKNMELDSFTHELLHIYIDDLGMTTPKELMHSIRGEKSFNVLTNKDLFSILHNFLSHKKMYPLYIEMGFSKENFIQSKASLGFLQYFVLKQQFRSGKIEGLTDFIGITISLLCDDENLNSRYSNNKLNKLKILSPSLYPIIKKLIDTWDKSLDYNLLDSFFNFNIELEEWINSDGAYFKIKELGTY